MKKSYLFVSALVLGLGLTACGKKEEPAPAAEIPAAEAPAPAMEAPLDTPAADAPAADTTAPADATAPAETPVEQPAAQSDKDSHNLRLSKRAVGRTAQRGDSPFLLLVIWRPRLIGVHDLLLSPVLISADASNVVSACTSAGRQRAASRRHCAPRCCRYRRYPPKNAG